MNRFNILLLILSLLIVISCDTAPETDETVSQQQQPEPDSVVVLPAAPLDIILEFSNKLGMNDPACYTYLTLAFLDTLQTDSLSPREIFGRWRAFDATGRLTEPIQYSDGYRTSYYCTISRMERPPVVRIELLLCGDEWKIEGFAVEVPDVIVSPATIEQMAEEVLMNPDVCREFRVMRMLLDDCSVDSIISYESLNSAVAAGSDFRNYILDITPEAYEKLANSNIRRGGKYQIITNRIKAVVDVWPASLIPLANVISEMMYLNKSILYRRHESMQSLNANGIWEEPDILSDMDRLRGFRSFFYAISEIVEADDSLSVTYLVVLTTRNAEPLPQVVIDLDPHQVEQTLENDLGIPIWRALSVEMNGDMDPEKIIYWAGNLFLFQGEPNGYRLVWRTFENYESDYHTEFVSRSTTSRGMRDVYFIGNGGEYEYTLSYTGHDSPLFRRFRLQSSIEEIQ